MRGLGRSLDSELVRSPTSELRLRDASHSTRHLGDRATHLLATPARATRILSSAFSLGATWRMEPSPRSLSVVSAELSCLVQQTRMRRLQPQSKSARRLERIARRRQLARRTKRALSGSACISAPPSSLADRSQMSESPSSAEGGTVAAQVLTLANAMRRCSERSSDSQTDRERAWRSHDC